MGRLEESDSQFPLALCIFGADEKARRLTTERAAVRETESIMVEVGERQPEKCDDLAFSRWIPSLAARAHELRATDTRSDVLIATINIATSSLFMFSHHHDVTPTIYDWHRTL